MQGRRVRKGVSKMGRRYNMFKVCSLSKKGVTPSVCCNLASLRREKRRSYKVTISEASKREKGMRFRGSLKLMDRILQGSIMRGVGNSVKVKRIHCSAAKRSITRGTRPLMLSCVGKDLTLTRGKGLIGARTLG